MLDEYVRLQELGQFIVTTNGYSKCWDDCNQYLSHKNLCIDIPINPLFSFACGHLYLHSSDTYDPSDRRLNISLIFAGLLNRHVIRNHKYLAELIIAGDKALEEAGLL